MKDIKPGDIFTNESRRCVNCGGEMTEGGMLQSGVHCLDCMPVLGKDGTYKTLAHWKLILKGREHIDPADEWYNHGPDVIISTAARLCFFGIDNRGDGDTFYYLAYK